MSMEATESKDPNMEFFPPPKSDVSRSPRFSPPQNGFYSPRFRIPDIELMAVQSSSSFEYTSLKDLLPSASPAAAMSPTPSSSWHEIPIRNPLVKHAAMAYLQPMSTPTTSFGDKGGVLGKLKEMCLCGGEYGCLGWLCDVVSRAVQELFGELVLDRRRDSEEEDEDQEDEDEDDEKVD